MLSLSSTRRSPTKRSATRRRLAAFAVLSVLATSVGVVGAEFASASTCSDVDVVFARGTMDPGIVGRPFANAVKAALPGKNVTVYNVNYAADVAQTSAGAGATDMTKHVTLIAGECADTKFILGGYSQGASVTDIAIGLNTALGKGDVIPADLAPRVSAVVVFGNPLGLTGGHLPTASALYGAKAKEFCNTGDPVCGGGFNAIAHALYGVDGSTTAGAKFAAERVLGS